MEDVVSLDCKIMAHPTRARYVKQLQKQLDRPVEVIYDQVPTPSADPAQRWEVTRRAWSAINPDAEWGCVLQDDVLVSKNLLAGLEQALEQMPDKCRNCDKRRRSLPFHSAGVPHGLVSAYAGTGRPNQPAVQAAIDNADTHDHAWWALRSLYWGPAIVVPTWTIGPMLEWCSRPWWDRQTKSQLDYRIGVFFRKQMGWRTWHPHPSLVEHRKLPSLVGNDTGPIRKAHRFHRGSALVIDWTRTPPGGLEVDHAERRRR